MVSEAVALRLGSAIATAIAKLWVKDRTSARSADVSLAAIFAGRVPKLFDRRRAEREFERMAEIVSLRIAPLLQVEFADIPPNETEAALLAVADTFHSVAFDERILLQQNLDPRTFERYVRDATHELAASASLSEPARGVYDVLVHEAATYIVEIITTLPTFEFALAQEVLQREAELADLVREVLARLPQRSLSRDESDEDAAFELAYRREIARQLDELELFGVDIPYIRKRYQLSVAYITLTAGAAAEKTLDRSSSPHDDQDSSGTAAPDAAIEEAGFVRIDAALAQAQRVLVRGDAGSGKTTLLQWLAVSSAREEFKGKLEEWNGRIPFFIQLRRYVDDDLPTTEGLIDRVANTIGDLEPRGWVSRVLRGGRGLILVDGVDELPEAERAEVRRWLQAIIGAYPESRVVVTSRPPAIEEKWLEALDFADRELQPMTLSDIDAFVDHWHRAAQATAVTRSEERDLVGYKSSLKRVIRTNRPIRALATNPLLCALLCALNRERRTQLPRRRMELYRIALEMLLERRDVERRVPRSDVVLDLPEKQLLLEDLAFHLILNQQSDITKPAAVSRIAAKLGYLDVDSSPEDVLAYLLERSGVLREPIEGRIDFLHRTFQEYLGAREAIAQGNIPFLVQQAHLDQWRETIVLAAGHAQRDQRAELLEGLVERGRVEPRHRHVLHLLAVACLETSLDLDQEVREHVIETLSALVPPGNMSEARALSSAGELAVPRLRGWTARKAYATTTAACVRALALIGGDEALDALSDYGPDTRVTVGRELIRAWTYFEPTEYAERVLADSPLDYGRLVVDDRARWPGLGYLKHLSSLGIRVRNQAVELADLSSPLPLRSLHIAVDPAIENVNELARFPTLDALTFFDCTALTDIHSLSELPNIRYLSLSYCPSIGDFSAIGKLKNLARLALIGGAHSNFDFLSADQPLAELDCDSSRVEDIEGLRRVGKTLTSLDIRFCSQIKDFEPLADLKSMRFLFMNSTLVSNLEPLAEMRRLLILDGSMNRITDVTPLWDMRDLNYLNLSGNLNLQDIEPLIDCVGLEDLDISGTAVTDLSPLYYMTDLDLIVSPRVKLHDLPIEFRQTNRITRRADPVSGAGYRSDLDDGAFELAIDLNE